MGVKCSVWIFCLAFECHRFNSHLLNDRLRSVLMSIAILNAYLACGARHNLVCRHLFRVEN